MPMLPTNLLVHEKCSSRSHIMTSYQVKSCLGENVRQVNCYSLLNRYPVTLSLFSDVIEVNFSIFYELNFYPFFIVVI